MARFAIAKKTGFTRIFGLDVTRQLSDFFSVDFATKENQNIGQWTGEQYTNVFGTRYVQIVANFNASSSTFSVNPGSKVWVALTDVSLLDSSEIRQQNTPKPSGSIFDWVKPTTENQTTSIPNETKTVDTWQLSTWYSIGTAQNVARIRTNPGGAIMIDNIKYGSPVIVEARRQYWKGDWIPARVKEGVWGWIHSSVVSPTKPVINSQSMAEAGKFDYNQPKPVRNEPTADLPIKPGNTTTKKTDNNGVWVVAIVAMAYDLLKKAKII